MLHILINDCRPCLYALGIALVALLIVLRVSGARLDLGRLRQLHGCQRGGVQSLAFVLTLPIFVMIVMFIVQVSQLMIGQVVVNYAAFGAARSLAAWVPQYVVELEPEGDPLGLELHGQNVIRDTRFRSGQDFGYCYVGGTREDGFVDSANGGPQATENLLKFDRAFRSATSACATISPSRHLGLTIESKALDRFDATWSAWQLFATTNASSQTRSRLYNKFCYSFWNTELWIRFQNRNAQLGPTYNPIGHPVHQFQSNEVGWQDPITVLVRHNLALLPGPGRWLAKHLVTPGGPPDRVSNRIAERAGPRRQTDTTNDSGSGPHDPLYNRRVFTTTIWARATVTNDGVKSLVPYMHAINVAQ
ncbi:MAG: pilus assembly protein [Planctomycetaceae bacterium]|nr:pilus assembly protein [Planctomycetaceae bacterium]